MSKTTYKTSSSIFEFGTPDKFGVSYKVNKLIKNSDKELTTYTVDDATTVICDCAFWKSNKLEHVTLPQGLKAIGERAFQECSSLKEIHIPAGVEVI